MFFILPNYLKAQDKAQDKAQNTMPNSAPQATKKMPKQMPKQKLVVLPKPIAKKVKQKIPLLINIGAGLSQYKLFDVYNDNANNEDEPGLIFGTELAVRAVIENSTIRRFKNKVPKKYRKAAMKIDEASVTHFFVPKTLYIQPQNGNRHAYGATWGIVPTLAMGPRLLSLGLRGGPILTYLYYKDDRFDDAVHFIRPGLRGGIFLQSKPFRYLKIELGGQGDIYIPKKFYADDKSLWNMRGSYFMIHLRFPAEVEAAI